MTMTAERPNTDAELQYDNPFADFPTFEEMQNLRAQKEKESSVSEQFDNPFADDYFDKQAAKEQKPEPQEQQERRIVAKHIHAAGERSTIYKLEMSDGKEGTEIESDYPEISSNFLKQHEEIKNDFHLGLAMSGFPIDLAVIDATRGDCYNNADSEQRANLLQDYGKLRERLDSPNTSPAEKQLISDYLDQMKGSALDFVQTQYEQNKGADGKNERIKLELEDLKSTLEKSRRNFEENLDYFDRALRTVDELLQDTRYYDELPQAITKLKRSIEDAFDAAKKFRNDNNEYIDAASRAKSSIGEDEYRQSQKTYDDYDETIQQALKKLNNADEYAHDQDMRVRRMLDIWS